MYPSTNTHTHREQDSQYYTIRKYNIFHNAHYVHHVDNYELSSQNHQVLPMSHTLVNENNLNLAIVKYLNTLGI